MATQDTRNPILANSIISPGFKSAAAMAGWDEEALLATLVVEDTPIRESRHKRRPNKSSSNSKKKRRLRRQSIDRIPAVVLCLDDEEDDDAKKDVIPENKEKKDVVADEEDEDQKKNKKVDSNGKDASNKGIACMDKLREELSCAICLEICFEPSTTQCGHSFCMKCLKYSASKCGKKCPKCRQLISNARSCTINTVLWNTIQLLFPDDIEARKNTVTTKADSPEPANHRAQINRNTRIVPRSTNFVTAAEPANHRTQTSRNTRSIQRSTNFVTAAQVVSAIESDIESSLSRRRRALLTQNQDAALALRLQREEFMEADRDENVHSGRHSVDSARANLRAMASSRYHICTRGRY